MFTPQCLLCHRPAPKALCALCSAQVSALVHSRTEPLRRVPGTLVPIYSFASYHGVVRDLVRIAKGLRLERSELLDPWLWLAASRLGDSLLGLRPSLIVPLPEPRYGLDSRRRLARDFAQLLASQLQVPCHAQLLRHAWPLKSYFRTPQKERRRVMRVLEPPDFCVPRSSGALPEGERIVIVDDVCTTGETLRAAIKALSTQGITVSAAALLADTPSYG
ncbi:MAG TPA: phosphoribosyltransferase family protein [Bdellovibrionota bacterium]|nr:phosphoribosyltransferase family protein [Bdellovibrionota bacterium]